jgi:hypothetical protein
MQGGLQDPKPNVFKGTYIEIKSVLFNKVAAEDVKSPAIQNTFLAVLGMILAKNYFC